MSSFLDRLEPSLANKVRAVAYERELEVGEVLVRQGERGRALYLVVRGALEAITAGEVVNLCEPGEVVGELAFLDGDPRSADLVAKGPSAVLVWTYDTMQRLVEQHPAIHIALLQGITERQTKAVRRLTEATVPRDDLIEVVALGRGAYRLGERIVTGSDGEPIKLSPTEARLLSYLAARPGRVVAYEKLLEEVWGYSRQVASRTVYATVHRLRSKVELDPSDPKHIISLSGEGYRFDP